MDFKIAVRVYCAHAGAHRAEIHEARARTVLCVQCSDKADHHNDLRGAGEFCPHNTDAVSLLLMLSIPLATIAMICIFIYPCHAGDGSQNLC